VGVADHHLVTIGGIEAENLQWSGSGAMLRPVISIILLLSSRI